MAWSVEFTDKIAASFITPIYLFETAFVSLDDLVGPGTFNFSSAPVLGYDVALVPEGSSISGGMLNVTDWTFTTSQWQIGIDPAKVRSLQQLTVRGQVVVLKIGFPGWSVSQFQTVAIGHLKNIIRNGDKWTAVVSSLLGGLTSRWVDGIIDDDVQLFQNLPIETFVTKTGGVVGESAYTVDDPVDGLTIELDNTFGISGEGNAHYILRVQPDDGDVLYIYCASKAGDVFTVTEATLFDISGDIENEVPATPKSIILPVAGEEVNNVEIGVLIKDGNPAHIVRKVLTSTGVSLANGPYDTLPAAMGIGLPEEYFDIDTFDFAATILQSVGVGDLYAYAFNRQDDALSWMGSVLSPFGAFLCERQGQISIGVISLVVGVHGWFVTDTDIVDITYQSWNDGQPVEYGEAVGVLPLTEDEIVELPGAIESRPNVADHITEFPYINGAADAAWADDALSRTELFRRVVAEEVVLTLRGWRLGGAAPGDHLIIDSVRIRGRRSDTTLGTVDGRCHIIAVDCDWFGSTTKVRALYIPLLPAV